MVRFLFGNNLFINLDYSVITINFPSNEFQIVDGALVVIVQSENDSLVVRGKGAAHSRRQEGWQGTEEEQHRAGLVVLLFMPLFCKQKAILQTHRRLCHCTFPLDFVHIEILHFLL